MNEKSPETIERFIELRAADVPYEKIAAELDVAKSTLMIWSRRHRLRIQNLRALQDEAQVEQCRMSHRACVENLGEDLRRLREALAQRDLSQVPTWRLLAMATRLRAEAGRVNGRVRLSEALAEDGPEDDQNYDPIVQWEG